jgi:hypothetical protein
MSDEAWEAQYENLPWMHIYPQFAYHGAVRITGTPSALLGLAAALEKAAQEGSAKGEGITVDGEGYPIEITRTNRTGMGYTNLPYTADFARDLRSNPSDEE